MVSTWSSGSTFPPTNFQSMFDNSNPDDEFTFVDFLPECRSPSGFFSQAKYETFRSTVDRANIWLRANPQWEVKTCESVEFKDSGDVVKTEKMFYVEQEGFAIRYIRGMRLWISKRKSYKDRTQQIGYLNMEPQVIKEGGVFSSAKFENLDDLVNRYNKMIRSQPIPGRIITIETQEMKMKNKNEVDPEKSNWYERDDFMKSFLFIIRIFFEVSDSSENVLPSEEIGIMDFVPNMLESAGFFTMPKYDIFSNTVLKASDWCSRQIGIRVCNAQSVEIKLKKGNDIDTQMTNFTESGNLTTYYVRIVRVAYVKSSLTSKLDSDPISHLTCKSFVPVQITRSIFVPEFESLSETRARVSAWIKATGAEVLSAETSAVRMFGGEKNDSSEGSFTYNRPERTEYWLFVIRVYMNGIYKEPPLEMLPPVPVLEDQGCCVLL